jgi:iron complex transport system substrate-binding protein
MRTDHTPQRVVSLQPSATVILDCIGQLDRLVACTKYCADVCPQIRTQQRIIVADSWTAHGDEIIFARPDLVIAAVPYQEKAVIEILKAGARFLGLAPKTLADIYVDISVISGIMGVPEAGKRIIAQMQDKIATVRRKTAGVSRQKVFCEEWGKPLIASQRWVAELVEAAGGEFLGSPGAQLAASEVPAENPDVLIADWCGAGDRVPLEKIVRDRGWEELRAVQNNRVYCIRDEFLNTPAPTLLQGLDALAAAIQPDRFAYPPGLRCIADRPNQSMGAN